MDILTQQIFQNHSILDNLPKEELDELTADVFNSLLSPIDFSSKVETYTQLNSFVGNYAYNWALCFLKKLYERIDINFRNKPLRTQRYYVKQTRDRTIVTLYGPLTFRRTEYIDRFSGESYCHVDYCLAIRKRERYDSCVQNLIISYYANNNSMIKVGELVGDRISGAFNLRDPRHTAICRQTVQKIILRRFKSLYSVFAQQAETPSTLYIMADELFVGQQRGKGKEKEGSSPKQMVKEAVIFEGIETIKRKNGTATTRKRLINKMTVACCSEQDLWEMAYNAVNQRYDLEKVKAIYILGDGATWIKRGTQEMKQPGIKTMFGIDKFHYNRAINFISLDTDQRKILKSYAYHNTKEDFKYMADCILLNNPQRQDVITESLDYILKHWNSYQAMNKVIKVGCSMESQISHTIASVFTSVPKGYAKENLPTYLSLRMIQQNHPNMRKLIIEAMDKERRDRQDVVISAHEYDFSIFDKTTYETEVSKYINKNTITKF